MCDTILGLFPHGPPATPVKGSAARGAMAGGGEAADSSTRAAGISGVARLFKDVGGTWTAPTTDFKLKDAQLPSFDGHDPLGWVARAEQHFVLHGVPEEIKVSLARVAMEDVVLHWSRWHMMKHASAFWIEFSQALVTRFDDRFMGNPYERMVTLRQTGSVDEYVNLFTQLATQAQPLTEAQALGYYLGGLKQIIRNKLRVVEPPDLESAIRNFTCEKPLRHYEITWLGAGSSISSHTAGRVENRHSTSSNIVGGGGQRSVTSAPSSRGSTRKLSRDEYRECQEKRLCYKCKPPYSPLHKCESKYLNVAVKDDLGNWVAELREMREGEFTEEAEPTMESDEPPEEETTQGALPLYALAGFSGPRTMRLCSSLFGFSVTVLIDSGASHNFISQKLVLHAKLNVDATQEFNVVLGVGRKVASTGVCSKLSIQIDGAEVQADCHVFPLGGVDIILGVAWLRTLRKIQMDWEALEMQLYSAGQQVTFRSDPRLYRGLETIQNLLDIIEVEFSALLLRSVIENYHSSPENGPAMLPEIVQILEEFPEVFAEPNELPPTRHSDHRIPLKPGAVLASVRPYRYGQIQKDEIERFVHDMLVGGIICPSTSPFSSPVLLVKRKDGSWRFCVDYRELNKSTVADKYPIPVIQEILDELSGATIFSKIDLRSGYHQIRVAPEDVHKTAFRIYSGQP
ncbi:uncharacterized protein LOC127250469 [Andrographis paniculata]|uniref:uncharacterized protein LOC127250469 n=1 Tax=Andrographis paniculata TaxID=175694 RepID=UPI0021E7CD92|nr:uncharacterized protein LOC127250469 [Andrographis paniculata]